MEDPYEVYEKCLVEIPEGTWHMAETGLEILVIGIPPVQPEDVYYKGKNHAENNFRADARS